MLAIEKVERVITIKVDHLNDIKAVEQLKLALRLRRTLKGGAKYAR